MFILRDLLTPLEQDFSTTNQGKKRSIWFIYTLLAVVVPFTSSITSNLLRALQTLFGFTIEQQRFYTFMASTTLLWNRLWRTMWNLIPNPLTEDRLLVVLDDFINPKTGRKIFACGYFHDHAAKDNQSSYPWSQRILGVAAENTAIVSVVRMSAPPQTGRKQRPTPFFCMASNATFRLSHKSSC
jgi:hypothetical protein